jgi:hypothetical protein
MYFDKQFDAAEAALKIEAEAIALGSSDPVQLLASMLRRLKTLEQETREKECSRKRECTMYAGVFKALGFVGKDQGYRFGTCSTKAAIRVEAVEVNKEKGGDGNTNGAGIDAASAADDDAIEEEAEAAIEEEAEAAINEIKEGAAKTAAEAAASVMARNERMRVALARLRHLKSVLKKDGRWKSLVMGEHNAGFCLEQSQLLVQLLKGNLTYTTDHPNCTVSPYERVMNELLVLARKSKDMSQSNRLCLNSGNNGVYRDSEHRRYEFDEYGGEYDY